MFKFFTNREWFLWAWIGGLLILLSTWYQVQLDVKINEWFGKFYDIKFYVSHFKRTMHQSNLIVDLIVYD